MVYLAVIWDRKIKQRLAFARTMKNNKRRFLGQEKFSYCQPQLEMSAFKTIRNVLFYGEV